MTRGKKAAVLCLAVVAVLALLVGGFVGRLFHAAQGERTGEGAAQGSGGIMDSMGNLGQIVGDPRAGFPGKSRVTILCMGLDDNWTDKDMVYTVGSRTDTLFLLTLDLDKKTASMLSIPRDTYAHIAGTDRDFKINDAYSSGGPQRSIQTVAGLLGVTADHYMVLNIDATRKMVDALGGVDVDVPHEMHYHDKWGHLSIDLLPGPQHLNGDNAVGFARYRHPDAGKKATPEDGDVRRMARQHILLRSMIDKAKSLDNLAQGPHLIDVGMSAIRTDLTRTQLFDLAALFHGVQQDDIRTASLPGDDFRGPKGEWYYRINPKQSRAYVDWLVRGDDTASRRLVPVVVQNGTHMPGLAARVAAQLQASGYTDVRNGGNVARARVQLTAAQTGASGPQAQTQLLDTGVSVPNAGADAASVLGLSSAVTRRLPNRPNKAGWTEPGVLLITVGEDYARAVKASGLPAAPPAAETTQN
jgi:LCP family protein required for cell wall assembly